VNTKPYKKLDPENHLNWLLRTDIPELYQHHLQRSKTDDRYINSFRSQTDIIEYLTEDKNESIQYGKKYWKQNDWCLYRLQMVYENNKEEVNLCDKVFEEESYYTEQDDIYTEEHMNNAWEKVETGYIERKKARLETKRKEIQECRETGILFQWLSPDEVWTKEELIEMGNKQEKTESQPELQLSLF
tara:strand:- start:753 stop:1313 length:561 start_codon:yes stop_codon:yes gene_type:complete